MFKTYILALVSRGHWGLIRGHFGGRAMGIWGQVGGDGLGEGGVVVTIVIVSFLIIIIIIRSSALRFVCAGCLPSFFPIWVPKSGDVFDARF